MRILSVLLLIPLCTAAFAYDGEEVRCHSQQFTNAKRQLGRMVLTSHQKAAIKTYEAEFHRKWNKTHREKGCRHHEAHANEFIAAASGVLTDKQFKAFRKRARTEIEKVQYEVWQTGKFIDDLIKIAGRL